MTAVCQMPGNAGLVTSLLSTVDCSTQGVLADGYAALAAPAGPVAIALTSAMTLYVGFFGYRLLAGRGSINVGSLTVMAVKLGLVLVLAGNWALYQQLICRTLFGAPQQVAELMLDAMHRSGSVLSPDPLVALQQAFDELMRDVRSLASHAGDGSPLLGGPGFATMATNASAYGLVFASAGTIAVAHIGLTLLLALGPVVIGLLLFDTTRGLVEGWLRAMIGLTLVSLAATLLVPIELSMLEPTLLTLAGQRVKDAILPETAMMASFMIAIGLAASLGSVLVAWTIARGIKLPSGTARRIARVSPAVQLPAQNPSATLSRAERIGVALERRVGITDRRGAHQTRSMALQSSLAAGDRRLPTKADNPVFDGQLSHVQRAARPRRELIVARRKK